MQVKIFTIPILGGEAFNEEMNAFLRGHRIISVEDQLVQGSGGGWWVFKVQYAEGAVADREKPRVDYRQVLDEPAFKRFTALREIRKKIAKDDAVPAYVIFTDEELSELAKLELLTEASMKSVKGIGEQKLEKYGRFFLQPLPPNTSKNEKGG
jgi:superfamily II DNA helicase RecQ